MADAPLTVPALGTDRLIVRPLVAKDLDAIHRILDIECADTDFGSAGPQSRDRRQAWLQWTIAAYTQLAALNQPPYGDRAVVLRGSGELIGACGLVPCLAPFAQLPSFGSVPDARYAPEVGLFYACARAHRRRGYMTEAARALVEFAFRALRLRRIVAMTTADNAASMAVMRKLGMRLEHNPRPQPPWLQVVGIVERADG